MEGAAAPDALEKDVSTGTATHGARMPRFAPQGDRREDLHATRAGAKSRRRETPFRDVRTARIRTTPGRSLQATRAPDHFNRRLPPHRNRGTREPVPTQSG